eukprot:gene8409-5890_t
MGVLLSRRKTTEALQVRIRNAACLYSYSLISKPQWFTHNDLKPCKKDLKSIDTTKIQR